MAVLSEPGAAHRFDHQSYAPEVWGGLALSSLYLLQAEPVVSTVEDTLERALDAALGLGAILCLIGVAIGTHLFFPRAPHRVSYGFQLVGLPLIIVALAWYTYAAADLSRPNNLLLTALGGGLGLCIEIGSLRMFVDIVAYFRQRS